MVSNVTLNKFSLAKRLLTILCRRVTDIDQSSTPQTRHRIRSDDLNSSALVRGGGSERFEAMMVAEGEVPLAVFPDPWGVSDARARCNAGYNSAAPNPLLAYP